MDHTFPNDMHINIAGKPHRLRASIGALCAIEQYIGLPIHTLTAHNFTPVQAAYILERGLEAAGYKDITCAKDESQIRDAAQAFIRRSLTSDEILNWREMFVTFTGVMNRPVQEFWNITLAEYSLALEGFCMMHGLEPHRALSPATSQELAEMVRRFG